MDVSDLLPTVLADDGTPLTVWRGESSGELFDTFDRSKTYARVGFFFAEQQELAGGYAGYGTAPRAFTLRANRVLDLRDPYERSVRAFLQGYAQEFDSWIDRRSGEEADVYSFLETGSLYDYEGTGSAERWNSLFVEAFEQGFDAVRVFDSTDGIPMGVVWVVQDPGQVVFAQPKVALGLTVEPLTLSPRVPEPKATDLLGRPRRSGP